MAGYRYDPVLKLVFEVSTDMIVLFATRIAAGWFLSLYVPHGHNSCVDALILSDFLIPS